jgi:ABC-type multidrug transport system fused ATPase/permease subunit
MAQVTRHPLFKDLRWHRLVAAAREFAPYLRSVHQELGVALACSVGGTLMIIARPWPMKMVFDYALTPASRIKWVFPFHLLKGYGALGVVAVSCLLLFLISLLWGVFAYNQRYFVATAGQEVTYALRRKLFRHLACLSLSFHHQHSVGDLLLRATGDTNMLREMLVDATLIVLTEFLVLAGMVGVMLYMDWQLTMISLTVLPLLAVAVFRISGDLRTAVRRQRKKEGRMAALFGEMLQGISVIQVFGREAYEEERFGASNRRSLRQARRTVRLEANLERVAEVLIAIGTGAVLWFGVRRVLAGVLTPGDLLVFTAYLSGTYRPLRRIAFVSARLSKATICAERVFSVLRVDERVKVSRQARPAPPFRGRVSFKEVSFAYQPKEAVLQEVSFGVAPGQTVAVVGPNGAGKSTLCALLPRLYDPCHGRIRIDGERLNHFTLESLRDQFGVVQQQPLLFSGTVRDNIAYGKPEASDEEIEAAARLADVHEFVAALPRGYDTPVGERGETLSGGQRQKIAIARAIIKDPPILILDEPTASLDATSAVQVNATLARVAAGKTTFRVAHRLAEVCQADQILVLEQGRITQRGTHAYLMTQSGWYRTVFELQQGEAWTGATEPASATAGEMRQLRRA